MPKLTYRIENAPGRIYGKNSNELTFKEPSSGALIYSTTTASGLLKSTKKQLFRGPPGEKDGGVLVATLDEPSGSTNKDESLEMHHHKLDGRALDPASTKLKLKKTSSWVPLSGNNLHAVTFRDVGYTWSGKSTLKRDKDGRVVAKVTGPWFWEGKLGDMEVDIPEMGDEDDRRGLLEMVLGTFVARWWGDKAAEEERARELKKKKQEAAQVKAVEKKAAAQGKKEEEQRQKEQKEEEEAKKVDASEQQASGS